jgi:hypothetical protein
VWPEEEGREGDIDVEMIAAVVANLSLAVLPLE